MNPPLRFPKLVDRSSLPACRCLHFGLACSMWVVVKILVPLCVLSIIRHLIFRGGPKRDHNLDSHRCGMLYAARSVACADLA